MSHAISPLAHSISEHHKDLYQCFLLHQEALLCDEYSLALEVWQVFEAGLCLHISLENQYLFNATDTLLATEQLNWGLHVYQKEHDKIENLLAKLSAMMIAFDVLTGRKRRLALLDLLEKQISFRQVLEHHEEREERDALLVIEAIESQSAQQFMAELDEWRQLSQPLIEQLKTRFND